MRTLLRILTMSQMSGDREGLKAKRGWPWRWEEDPRAIFYKGIDDRA